MPAARRAARCHENAAFVMTLKQLEAFYLAAQLGSFALAAQRLHVTQSSLSKRIAELEQALDTPLFDRSSQRAQLTEAGRRLLPTVAQMLALKSGLHEAAQADHGQPSGLCRFGITELAALTWLPAFVARVREDFPALALQPQVGLGRRLEQQVRRGELDFAIVPGPPEDTQLASQAVDEVRFVWAAAPARAAGRRVLQLRDLESHPIITQTDGSSLSRAFETWAREQGLRPHSVVASNSLMAIVGLTVADIGLSFLPEAFMQPWVERGLLVALRSRPALPVLTYCFVHREDDRRALVRLLLPRVAESVDHGLAYGLLA